MDKKEKILLLIICLVSIPAFFTNLGMFPFIEDEAIRALVAFEMLESGNYIVPTLNGLPYYYKPPLYNYFIALSFSVFGEANEFTSRVPTILFLFLSGAVIFKCFRQYFDSRISAITVLWYMTCGRILFWDSFLGLIDIAYSLVSFLVMFLSYHFYINKSYWKLYIVTFSLTAIGYLLKGFPSFLFLGMSIMAVLLYKKDIKKLLHPAFAFGLLVMVSIIGGYYFIYSQYHDYSNVIGPLLDQSTRRTIVRFSILDVVKHFFTYPFENIYHFLPYTLPGFLLLYKQVRVKIFGNDFLVAAALLFVVNGLVYWLSPEVFPRYILMLLPLSFIVILNAFEFGLSLNLKGAKAIKYFFQSLPIIALIALLYLPFHGAIEFVQRPYLFIGIGALAFIVLSMLIFKHSTYFHWYTILNLLLIRVIFNFVFIPERTFDNEGTFSKLEMQRLVDTYGDRPIKLWNRSIMDKTSSFYLATAKGSPNVIDTSINSDIYYVVDTMRSDFPKYDQYEIVDSFLIREYDRRCYLISSKE